MSTATFYPLGNADCLLIKADNGKLLLFDYGNVGDPANKDDRRIDLKKAVQEDIGWPSKKEIDVVAFTHGDNDHVQGASEMFWLEHAVRYQNDQRVKIRDLWVPAAMIVEEGVEGDNRVLRQEARYRLIKGSGVRVFSRPEMLKSWLAERGLTLHSREHLITDAGQLVPGLNLQTEGMEFFVHSPFAHRHDGGITDRNQNCLVMQAVFLHDGWLSRLLITADSEVDDWNLIVDITKAHAKSDPSRLDRLKWDIFKCPHHCSYGAMSKEKGETVTQPSDQFRWLLEQGSKKSVIVSSSWSIPKTDEIQPPHFQTYNRYKESAEALDADLQVTMEHPKPQAPDRMVVKIDGSGVMLKKESIAAGVSIITQKSPRMGYVNSSAGPGRDC